MHGFPQQAGTNSEDSFENTTESIARLLGLGLAQRNITLQNAKIKLPLFMFLLLTDSPIINLWLCLLFGLDCRFMQQL